MKRIEAWNTLHEMWADATREQKEALGIAMDDIEFVDLMRGHGVPLTNAQYIRSMTDEELATELLPLFEELCEDGIPSPEYMRFWLQQPYKEDT